MARTKQQTKAKEPVRLREQQLADGRKSLYLDIYFNGKRNYKFLNLYLVPEVDAQTKIANANTLEQAKAHKSEKIYEITNKIAGIKDNSRKAKMLFTDWMQIYLEHVEKKGSDVTWIARVIAELKDFEPNITLADVNRDFLVRFLNMLLTRKHKRSDKKEHMCKTTAFIYMDYLRAGLNHAVKERVLQTSPYKRISRHMVRISEHKREYLTVAEVTKLIKTPCKRLDLKQAFLFSCFTGLRIQDIMDLKWKHISKQGEVWQIEIIQFKTKQLLYLPLNRSARKWLPEQGDASPEDSIFPKLTIYYGHSLRAWIQSARIEKDVTMHVGRHTFATLCLTAGIDIYTTSQLLGHTTIRHTQRYAKIINTKKDEAVSRLDEAF
jgi:integrase